ncbi:hypothetical protein H632_c26p3 [Helicosporidium sp. ATCC 50920]|nr:hypothetical protein H632_c26p3 [Helicosporidium sp. ATCC 50920]|eukprot:KDD77076.1 hypothetical protein H632_c26p3 [Helicosporidium sp. ATCC 50920]
MFPESPHGLTVAGGLFDFGAFASSLGRSPLGHAGSSGSAVAGGSASEVGALQDEALMLMPAVPGEDSEPAPSTRMQAKSRLGPSTSLLRLDDPDVFAMDPDGMPSPLAADLHASDLEEGGDAWVPAEQVGPRAGRARGRAAASLIRPLKRRTAALMDNPERIEIPYDIYRSWIRESATQGSPVGTPNERMEVSARAGLVASFARPETVSEMYELAAPLAAALRHAPDLLACAPRPLKTAKPSKTEEKTPEGRHAGSADFLHPALQALSSDEEAPWGSAGGSVDAVTRREASPHLMEDDVETERLRAALNATPTTANADVILGAVPGSDPSPALKEDGETWWVPKKRRLSSLRSESIDGVASERCGLGWGRVGVRSGGDAAMDFGALLPAVGEIDLEASSGSDAARDQPAPPSPSLAPAAVALLGVLSTRYAEQGSDLSFHALSSRLKKGEAARLFYQLLGRFVARVAALWHLPNSSLSTPLSCPRPVLQARGCVEVKQRQPYGDVAIRAVASQI